MSSTQMTPAIFTHQYPQQRKSSLFSKKKRKKKRYLIWEVGNHSLLQTIFWPKNKILASFEFGWQIKDSAGLYSKRNIEINNKALRLSKVLKKSRRDLNNGEMKDSIQQLLNPSEQIHILLPFLFFYYVYACVLLETVVRLFV